MNIYSNALSVECWEEDSKEKVLENGWYLSEDLEVRRQFRIIA